MSLHIVKFRSPILSVTIIVAAIICVFCVWLAVKWNFATAISARTDQKDVAEIALSLAPDDPQTHFATAVIYQKTFDESDVKRSLAEYKQATALSPNNYICWLELGHARERSGDSAGAVLALKKALDLAPNYADVQWAYGNALLRSGETDAAFEQIGKAAAGKPALANAAVVTAMAAFDGDADKVRRSFGNTTAISGALVSYFTGQDKFADAVSAWKSIPEADRRTTFKDIGNALAGKLLSAKQFRLAASVLGDVSELRADVGVVFDGGFESGVKLRDAGAFEWLIVGGTEPQIALSTAQKHSGNNSLLMAFNTAQASEFRVVSQTVAVDPNTNYSFEAYVRSELKAAVTLRWEIVDAADGKVIAKTEPVAPVSEWAQLKAQFLVPATGDGVIIRLARTECPSSICPISGRVWFDDVTLRQQ